VSIGGSARCGRCYIQILAQDDGIPALNPRRHGASGIRIGLVPVQAAQFDVLAVQEEALFSKAGIAEPDTNGIFVGCLAAGNAYHHTVDSGRPRSQRSMEGSSERTRSWKSAVVPGRVWAADLRTRSPSRSSAVRVREWRSERLPGSSA